MTIALDKPIATIVQPSQKMTLEEFLEYDDDTEVMYEFELKLTVSQVLQQF